MIVQVALKECGEWLDVNITPLEFIGIIETDKLREYSVAALKFTVEGGREFVYDNVVKHSLLNVGRVSPWRIE